MLAAVQSLQSQTYSNIEIIIVDDGSTDNTYKICEDVAVTDSRIRLYRNEINIKIAQTLNRALHLSKGEYIGRMDGDDISLPDRVQKQMEYLLRHPNVDLVGVSLTAIDENGDVISEMAHSANFCFLKRTIRYITPVSHVWVAKKSVYKLLGGYRDIPGCEDYDFLLRMLSKKMRFGNVPDYFGYLVRLQREGNTQGSIGLRQRKMFSYVYGLYKERLKYDLDTFSIESMEIKLFSSNLSQRLYSKSSRFLNLAIIEKAKGNRIRAMLNVFASLISPWQILYVWQRVMYRILSKHNRRANQ